MTNITPFRIPGDPKAPFVAGEDLSGTNGGAQSYQYYFLQQATAGATPPVNSGPTTVPTPSDLYLSHITAIGQRPMAVLIGAPKQIGDNDEMMEIGVVDCIAGAAITSGSDVVLDAAGRAIPISSAVAGSWKVGVALTSCAALGDRVTVFINLPMAMQVTLVGSSFVGLFNEFAQNNVTAAGTTQANAFQLTGQTVRITTVAAGAGVLLPPSAAGLEVLLINKGANAVQVYGNGTDTIDGIATAVGVSQMPNSLVIYTCAVAGTWDTEGLATGYSNSSGSVLQTLSSQDGITPHSGGGQGAAVLLTKMLNRSSSGAAADSVILPVSQPGMAITYFNGGANSINVFPAVGEAINALGANAAFAAATLTVTIFYCLTAGQWFTK